MNIFQMSIYVWLLLDKDSVTAEIANKKSDEIATSIKEGTLTYATFTQVLEDYSYFDVFFLWIKKVVILKVKSQHLKHLLPFFIIFKIEDFIS